MAISWEYRVVGINITPTEEASAEKASKQLPGMSEEFIKQQFPEQYVNKKNTNVALQCQRIINIYGKYGWEHYQQGQLANTAMIYFKREKIDNLMADAADSSLKAELSAEEKALIQALDSEQHP